MSMDRGRTDRGSNHLMEDLRIHEEELQAQNEELRRAKNEIERSKNEYLEIYQQAPVGYLTLDSSLNITEGNETAARLFHTDMKCMTSTHIIRFVPRASQLALNRHLFRAVKNGSDSIELRMGRDENAFDAYLITRAFIEGDEVQRYRVIIEDITERKAMEGALREANETLEAKVEERTSELRESRERLDDAQRIGHIGCWEWDIRTGEQRWSGEQYRIFGLDPGRFVPTTENFIEYIHPDDKAFVEEIIGRIKSGETGVSFNFRIVAADGAVRLLSAIGEVTEFDDGGRPLVMVGTNQDITERRRMEDELKESEAKYRGLFENLQEVAAIYEYIIDDSGWIIDARLMEANPLWLKVNRISLEDAQGKRHSQLFGRKFFEETLPIFRRMKAPGEPVVVEKPFPPGGPESRLSYFPLDEHRFVVTIVDISQIKKAQRAMEEYAEELKRSNAELQQFAYVASHDLREPLRMVSSYLDILSKRYHGKALDEKAEEYMNFAIDGADRMSGMIDDLLTYSRINTQGKPLVPVDMDGALSTALKDLKGPIEESKASISHDALPTVVADETQMTLLLENLLSNAIKFHGEAAPQVRVSAKVLGNEWVFAVEDNGIGIDQRQKDHLFQMFQRLHTREEYPGTGIGLAIAKKIVERHGGHIWFESKVGRGTTFFFTIPVKRNDEQVR